MMGPVKTGSRTPEIEGISVQRMVRKIDFELIIGMKKDGQFGSVIVFGAGGIGAEGMADFSVGLPPLNRSLARRMMEETRIFRRIQAPSGVAQNSPDSWRSSSSSSRTSSSTSPRSPRSTSTPS